MVDRAHGEARDKARDSHNPLDVLTANAIPASLGLEQAGAVMETDRTKWLVALCTAGWLFKSQANVHSTIFSVGAIICLVMGKILRAVMTQPTPKKSGKNTIGMPSLHALTLFYIATYFSTGFIWQAAKTIEQIRSREGDTEHGGSSHADPLLAINAVFVIMKLGVGSAAMVLVAGGLAYHRVQVGHHTTSEVSYGITFGTLFGVSWAMTAGDVLMCLKPLSMYLIENKMFTQVKGEFEEWEFEMGITLQDANIQTGAFGYPGAAVICFLGLLAMWDWDGQRQAAPAPGKTE